MQFVYKLVISAFVIGVVSEVAKRYSLIGAVIASLPLTSILALTWLYHDTKDKQKVIDLSQNIFWVVLPSLIFFIALPLLLKSGLRFGVSMIVASVIMAVTYVLYVVVLNRLGIRL